MNIFYLDHDPRKAATMHADKHVIKMIIEYAQLLSAAHHIHGSAYAPNVYKLTHKNHPSAKWARAHRENYDWLYSLWCALLLEYNHRWCKHHSSARLIDYLSLNPVPPAYGGFTQPPLAMPDEFKLKSENHTHSYQNYYNLGKRHLHKWSHRPTPDWIT